MTEAELNEFKHRELERFKATALESRILRVEEDALTQFTAALSECESPIEAKLLTAMFEHPSFDDGRFMAKGLHHLLSVRDGGLRFGCQVKVGKYRADILISQTHFSGTKTLLVIECDGHDYHERTKEQAARDRSRDRTMTAMGIRVLRFTGSEIHHDAEACADEIASMIECDMIDDWRMTNG